MLRLVIAIIVSVIICTGCKPCASCHDEVTKLVRASTGDSVFLHLTDYRDSLLAVQQAYVDSGYTLVDSALIIPGDMVCIQNKQSLEIWMENNRRTYGLKCDYEQYK